MAKLFLTRTFQKSFERLDNQVQTRIKKALEKLGDNPIVGKTLTGDLEGEFSLRVGDYRIIYMVDNDAAWLEAVGNRREVYKKRK